VLLVQALLSKARQQQSIFAFSPRMAAEAASGAAGAGAEVPVPIASSPLVLVTGVSGFIGAWTAAALLQLGYRVRGTVRSVAKKPEFSSVVSGPSPFEVVEANLTDPTGWPAAVAGCDYVLHVASPFFLGEVGAWLLPSTSPLIVAVV